jgi:LPXTG-site transpeptidase (sortase) family protein
MIPLIRAAIKRYLKWYSFPLIYFLVTSLLCAYAWYIRPIPYRAGIKAVFKTIALMPTLLLTGIITVWIIIAIISIPIVFWLKKRFPSQKEDILQEPSSHNKPTSFCGKTVNVSISVLGVILIVAGLSIALWVSRPYITFLFSTSKIETLEKKAELLGQVQRDEIKTSGTLEKNTEISAQVQEHETRKSAILGKTAVSQEVVQGDEIKKIEASETTAEIPKQVQKDATKKGGVLEQIVGLMRKDVTKKSEALEKAAEHIGQAQEARIIIPAALVDAPILEGASMEKLSEGVCHILKSAAPGKGGNCIIEGHNLGEFGWWRPEGPFNMLEVMEKGIHVYVFYKGKKYIYKVKEKIYTDVNDPKLYDFSPGERLTLITCTSTWNPTIYTNKRTVITAYPE